MTTRRERLPPASRRETIIAAGTPIFATEGYERARVSDIAAQVGVTEPVVYQNFGTKAGLFGAVILRAADNIAEHLGTLTQQNADVPGLLSHFLSADHLDRLHQRGEIGVLFAEAASGRASERVRDAAEAAIGRLVEALAGLIRRGQADGSLRDDVPAETLAWVVFSLIDAWGFRRRSTITSPELERELLEAALEPLRRTGPRSTGHV
jgi:AcrR family transcriptional regulator